MQFPWRKSDQSQARLIAAWHPNFRNRERLPDTKVVRTYFFVNFTAVTVVVCLALAVWYQEYRIRVLDRQVADWQLQISKNQKSAADAAALSRKFAAEEKKIRELDSFLQQKLVLSQFLLQLGKSLPADLVIDSVDIRGDGIGLRGTAAGSPVEATGRTSAYVELLQRDGYFKDIVDTKDVKQDVKREQSSGRVTFDLFMRFKGGAKK
jgi:Tfp pilus assembly protein PilN